MLNILHFSDLHFGVSSAKKTGKYRTSWDNYYVVFLDWIKQLLARNSIHVVIISGDIGSHGVIPKDKDILDFFKIFHEKQIPIITTNGNHEINRPRLEQGGQFLPYSLNISAWDTILNQKLSNNFLANQASYVYLAEQSVLFLSINSCKSIDSNHLDVGILSHRDFSDLNEEVEAQKINASFKFLICHHTLQEITESTSSVPFLKGKGISAIFSGHMHKFDVLEKLGVLNFIAGSPFGAPIEREDKVSLETYPFQFNRYEADLHVGRVQPYQNVYFEGTWKEIIKEARNLLILPEQSPPMPSIPEIEIITPNPINNIQGQENPNDPNNCPICGTGLLFQMGVSSGRRKMICPSCGWTPLQDKHTKKDTSMLLTNPIEIKDNESSDQEIESTKNIDEKIKKIREGISKKFSIPTINNKIGAQNLKENEIMAIITKMLSGDDFPSNFNIIELTKLSELFPKPYKDLWQDSKRNQNLLLSILYDGPISVNGIKNIRQNEWPEHPDKLDIIIGEIFGNRTDIKQIIWEDYLRGRITFIVDEKRTQDRDQCIKLWEEKAQRESKQIALKKSEDERRQLEVDTQVNNLLNEAQGLWDQYQQKKKLEILEKAVHKIKRARKIDGTYMLGVDDHYPSFVFSIMDEYDKKTLKERKKNQIEIERAKQRDKDMNKW